jgi:23S rRNA pseudouridine1911/1915/1917 synthase
VTRAARQGGDSPHEALAVLWKGDREAAVDKPAGLSSDRPQREARVDGAALDCAIARAREQLRWPEAQLPHRLDRPTRGVLMIAADSAQVAEHGREQREGRWTKWYIARIPMQGAGGVPAETLVGPQVAYLRREGRIARVVRSGGDRAQLEVLAVAAAADDRSHAHALIRLDTGRFHQIRVMLASRGFPLVGDTLYGDQAGGARARFQLVAAALAIERGAGSRVIEAPLRASDGVSGSIVGGLASAITAWRAREGSPREG